MKNIEVTMELRMCLEFKASEKEIRALEEGDIPKRIEEEFKKQNWYADSWHDFAVYDLDNQMDIVEWN